MKRALSMAMGEEIEQDHLDFYIRLCDLCIMVPGWFMSLCHRFECLQSNVTAWKVWKAIVRTLTNDQHAQCPLTNGVTYLIPLVFPDLFCLQTSYSYVKKFKLKFASEGLIFNQHNPLPGNSFVFIHKFYGKVETHTTVRVCTLTYMTTKL